MKKLFYENDRFTNEATDLDLEVCRALGPIFYKYVEMGFSPREISHIMSLSVDMIECEAILTKES